MTWPPPTRYANGDGVYLAHQVSGDGPIDMLVLFGHMIGLEDQAEGRHCARFLRRLGSFGRVIRFDRRGTGRSDPLETYGPGRLEQWVDDALTVLDAVGADRVAVIGLDPGGGYAAILLTAAHAERVSHLVLGHAMVRPLAGDGYPHGAPPDTDRELMTSRWTDALLDGDHSRFLTPMVPSLSHDDEFQHWWATAQRRFAAPAVRRRLFRAWLDLDLRAALPAIRVPTLVLFRSGFRGAPQSQYLGDHIPGARAVELPGRDGLLYVGDVDPVIAEIEEFITGAPRTSVAGNRVLVTVAFTDIVGSTAQGVAVGDRAWSQRLDAHDAMVRRQIERYRGVEVNTTGDGFVATFDAPGRAIDAARAIRDGARQLGIEIRAGLHTGEVEVRDDDISGLAVNIAARVLGLARAGEVLVSRTVADLVAGAGFRFEDRGEHELRGVPGSWRVHAVSG